MSSDSLVFGFGLRRLYLSLDVVLCNLVSMIKEKFVRFSIFVLDQE